MADDTEITEEVTEDVVEEAPQDEKSGDDTGDTEAQAEGVAKDTKTLLSDDEGDGAGDTPEKYEFVSPEDIGPIEMTPEVQAQFDQFSERAKEAGLTQAQYQLLVEGEIKRGRSAMEALAGDYQQRVDEWAETTRTDKELGGEDLAENLSVAKLGLDTFGTPELRALFEKPSPDNPTGLGIGNHPEIIRLLHRAGLQVKEDSDLVGGDGDKFESDASLRRMYPSMFKDDKAA